MDVFRLGSICRALRIKKRWRQADLASKAGVTRSTVSRLECGHAGELDVQVVVRIVLALGGRLELNVLWHGGELDRLLNARHSALHEAVARFFIRLPGWILVPEVSFSIRGERGVIDILAWHAATCTLLVIELKTEIVDINQLLGTVDRKRRLAVSVALERGWAPASVAVWVIVSESKTNRRRVQSHTSVLRAAFPANGKQVRGWLREPTGPLACLSFWPNAQDGSSNGGLATVKRVRGTNRAAA